MVERILKVGINARYVLFDKWFTIPLFSCDSSSSHTAFAWNPIIASLAIYFTPAVMISAISVL
jgi:hypothetical protein